MSQKSWSSAYRTSTPDVPRPDLTVWQPLESERIRWEGQVLIVGQDSDLPARLVITGKRLALIAGGEIALEFPLGWMRPEPKLLTENGIRLYISPNGDSQIAQPMLLRAQAGRAAAAEIAAVLTGRTFASRDADAPMHEPTWKNSVGASPSVALPSLKDAQAPTTNQSKPAWPPAETAGVKSDAAKPSADIVPWRTGASIAQPRPVPSETSRAARLLGTGSDGYTVSENVRKEETATTQPRKHHLPMWLLNLAIVAMLITGFGYVAVDRGWNQDDLRNALPGNIASIIGWEKKTSTEVALAPQEVQTENTPEDLTTGGDNTLLAVKDTTEKPTPTPTQEATKVAVIAGDSMDSIGGASNIPVTEGVGTPEATDEAEATETLAPTDEPVVEETMVATEEPTEVATEEPASQATVDPTVPQEEATQAPTAAPTQAVQTSQPASVAEGDVPDQEFQAGGIRYTVDAIEAGSSLASLPEINDIGQTWVVVTLTGANTSSADQQFTMSDFTLLADGNAIALDSGTAWVNNLLGNDPAYGNGDSTAWAPGEQHRFSLTFLAPANVSSLVLVAGDQQIPLDTSLSSSVPLTDVASDTAPAATLTGTVVEVIDGQTIVVDVDGEQITVKYLGIDAPTGDACYAGDATAANAALVDGQTVTLEREHVDTNARGIWVRDVWVTNADGQQVLVGQALVEEGAATANVSAPNNRYESWLNASQQTAKDNGAGLWSSCGN